MEAAGHFAVRPILALFDAGTSRAVGDRPELKPKGPGAFGRMQRAFTLS
jgi:hypothetical protein